MDPHLREDDDGGCGDVVAKHGARSAVSCHLAPTSPWRMLGQKRAANTGLLLTRTREASSKQALAKIKPAMKKRQAGRDLVTLHSK